MSRNNSYYYEQLNKPQQAVYYAIRQGLTELADEIPVLRLSRQELSDIYFMVRMDHPELFCSTTFRYRFYDGADTATILPEYIFSKDKIRDHKAALESRIRKLVLAAPKGSDFEKELYIHDFLCRNVHYDKLKKSYSHEIIGALGNGVAVCEGIAKAVKVLCDELGIWCIIVLSDNNPEKGIRYRHCWNIVKLDGKYYHLDVTFDNTLTHGGDSSGVGTDIGSREKGGRAGGSNGTREIPPDLIRRDYVNLPDKQIYRDHEPSIYRVPPCENMDHFYYKEKKLSWTTVDEVRSRTKQAVKKGRTLLFHWRGGFLNRTIAGELFEVFREEAAARGRYAACSLNMAQGVLCVNFYAEKQAEIVEEQANEGELYAVD